MCNVQPLLSSSLHTQIHKCVTQSFCKYFKSSICKAVKCRCKVQYPVPPSRVHAQKYKLVTWNICQDKNVCKALSSPPKAFITPCKFARITVCAILSMCYQVLCSKYVLALLSSLLFAFYDDIRNTLNNNNVFAWLGNPWLLAASSLVHAPWAWIRLSLMIQQEVFLTNNAFSVLKKISPKHCNDQHRPCIPGTSGHVAILRNTISSFQQILHTVKNLKKDQYQSQPSQTLLMEHILNGWICLENFSI